MKLFCILNGVYEGNAIKNIGKAIEIIQSKLDLKFDWKFEFTNDKIEYQEYKEYGKNYWGLNKYLINKYNTDAIGCHSIVYFYQATGMCRYNWCVDLDGRPQIQIVYQEHHLMPEIIAHELCHGFFANLRTKGVYLEDTLDKGEEKDRYKVLMDNLDKLKGLEKTLEDKLPIDNRISILQKSIKLAKRAIDILTGIRKLEDLGVAMAKMEGFYITGSRAYRNNNPLNLKFKHQPLSVIPDDDNFCVFDSVFDGWKTCYNDLKAKIEGRTSTGLNGKSTIKDLIFTWSHTDQQAYLDFVCVKLKIKEDFKIENFVY